MTKEYFLIAGAIAVGWLLISRPMSRQEAAWSPGVRFSKSLISVAVLGGCVWFAWWALSTRCAGGC
jgi:hypothetical protein